MRKPCSTCGNKKSEAIHPLADQTTLADIEEIEDSTILEMKADILMKALDLMDVNDKMILLMKYQDEMSHQRYNRHFGNW